MNRLRYWEGLRVGGEGDDRGWDGWMASPTQRTWVWVDSRSWWWTGRPGVLRFMGLQRVGYNWATELSWIGSEGFGIKKKEKTNKKTGLKRLNNLLHTTQPRSSRQTIKPSGSSSSNVPITPWELSTYIQNKYLIICHSRDGANSSLK